MKKILQIAVLILCVSSLARAQQKQSLSAAAATCTTTGTSCLITSVDPQAGGVTLTVTTNASGNTLVFEASGDGGTTWVALNATPSNSTTAATSTTSTGTWQANIAAYTNVRIRMSTLVSGTSTVSIIYSIASARAGGGGGGGGGVTSFSGDGTVITNSASTGAVTATIAGTSGGIPCFNSATTWQSSGAIAAGVLVKGGGAGACAGSSTLTDNGTAIVGTEPLRLGLGSVSAPSYSFSSSTTDGMYERSAAILDFGIGGSNPVFEMFTVSGGGARFPVGFPIGWSSTAAASGAYDTAISRDSAGVVDIGNGTAADKTGTLIAATLRANTGFSANGTAGISGSTLCSVTITYTEGLITACTAASDVRLKTFGAYGHGLDAIMQIQPIHFHWNRAGLRAVSLTSRAPNPEQIGFSAGNVRQAIPEAVGTERHGGVNYLSLPEGDRPIVAALVNAVKEQQAEIEELRAEIASLKK